MSVPADQALQPQSATEFLRNRQRPAAPVEPAAPRQSATEFLRNRPRATPAPITDLGADPGLAPAPPPERTPTEFRADFLRAQGDNETADAIQFARGDTAMHEGGRILRGDDPTTGEQIFAGFDEYRAGRQFGRAMNAIEQTQNLNELEGVYDRQIEQLTIGRDRFLEAGMTERAAEYDQAIARMQASSADPARAARFDAARADLTQTLQAAIDKQNELKARAATIPQSQAAEEFSSQATWFGREGEPDADGWMIGKERGLIAEWWDDPIGIVMELGGRSAANMLEMIPMTIAGGALGGPAGAIAGAFGGSAAVEYRASFADALAAAKVDTSSAEALLAAADNEELMAAAHEYAAWRAGIIGGVDAATMGIAGVTLAPFKNPLARELANLVAQTAVQTAGGGIGEAAAIAKTEGWEALTESAGRVGAEMAGEGISTIVDVPTAAIAGLRPSATEFLASRKPKPAAERVEPTFEVPPGFEAAEPLTELGEVPALPPPVIEVDPEGVARTPGQRFQEQQAIEQAEIDAQTRLGELGITPDIQRVIEEQRRRETGIEPWEQYERDRLNAPEARAPEGQPDARPQIKRSQRVPDARVDSLLEFVSKAGGIDFAAAEAEGLDPAALRTAGHGIRRAFRRGGMSMDQAAEALSEAGYFVTNEDGSYDPNVLLDRLTEELYQGKKSYSVQNTDFIGELAREEEIARGYAAEPDDLLGAGLTDTPELRTEVGLVARAIEIDEDAVEQAAAQFADDDAGFASAIEAIVQRGEEGRRGAVSPGPQGEQQTEVTEPEQATAPAAGRLASAPSQEGAGPATGAAVDDEIVEQRDDDAPIPFSQETGVFRTMAQRRDQARQPPRGAGEAELTRFAIEEGQRDARARGLDTSVSGLLGRAKNAPAPRFMRNVDGLDSDTRSRLMGQSTTGLITKGAYDPKTNSVYLFTDAITDPDDAAWVAAHEIAGHYGLQGMVERLGGGPDARAQIRTLLGLMRQNDTVAELADAIKAKRTKLNQEAATEEAMAELAAAVRTGRYDRIERKWGVHVPESMRSSVKGAIARFIERIKEILGLLTGVTFSDRKVRKIIEGAWRYVQTGDRPLTTADAAELKAAIEGLWSSVERAVETMNIPKWKQERDVWGVYLDGRPLAFFDTEAEAKTWLDPRLPTGPNDRPNFVYSIEKTRTAVPARGTDIWAKLKTMPGVKKEELEWLGIEEWLTAGTPMFPAAEHSREAVLMFIRKNGINVDEVIATEAEDGEGPLEIEWGDRRAWDDEEAWQHNVEDMLSDFDNGRDDSMFGSINEWMANELSSRAPSMLRDRYTEELAEWVAENPERAADLKEADEKGENVYYSFLEMEVGLEPAEDDQLRTDLRDEFEEAAQEVAREQYMQDPIWIVPTTGDSASLDLWLFGNDDMGWDIRYGGWESHHNSIYDTTEERRSIAYSQNEAEVQAQNYAEENELLGHVRDEDDPYVTKWGSHVMEGQHSNYREIKLTLPDVDGEFIEDGHFGDTNIVAFLRTTDRRLEVQGEAGTGDRLKTFFIDELQSDWHQQGRQYGYGPEDREVVDRASRLASEYDDAVNELYLSLVDKMKAAGMYTDESKPTHAFMASAIDEAATFVPTEDKGFSQFGDMVAFLQENAPHDKLEEVRQLSRSRAEAHRAARQEMDKVPDAPFKEDAWLALGLKRALLLAASEGHAAIAWQNARGIADRWGERAMEMYENQYDKKMPSIMRKLTQQQPRLYSSGGEEASLKAIREEGESILRGGDAIVLADGELRMGTIAGGMHRVNRTSATGMLEEQYDSIEAALAALTEKDVPQPAGYWLVEIPAELRQQIQDVGFPLLSEEEAEIEDVTLTGQGFVSSTRRGGRRVTVDPQKQTETEAFRRWFGRSKVVDANGDPLRVYHGTIRNFESFRMGDIGAHFGTAKAANDRILSVDLEREKKGAHGSNLMPVYLSIQNPLRTTDTGDWDSSWGSANVIWEALAQVDKELEQAFYKEFADIINAETGPDYQAADGFADMRQWLIEQGYDGIVYKNEHEDKGSDSWIVLRPNQIKSATGNRGTFDRSTNDITLSQEEPEASTVPANVQEDFDNYLKAAVVKSQRRAPGAKAAKDDAVDALGNLYTIGTIFAKKFTRELANRKSASLIGQKVRSYADLAAAAQIYRDPRFETLRLIFTNSRGKVVSQLGVSNRLPAAGVGFIGPTIEGYIADVAKAAKAEKATKVWVQHNHPSGDPTPSDADRRLTMEYTKLFASHGVTVQGHVVINHNRYGRISPDGRDVDVVEEDFGHGEKLKQQTLMGPFDVAKMARGMQIDQRSPVVLLLNGRHQVVGVADVDIDEIERLTPKTMRRMLYRMAMQTPSTMEFIVVTRDEQTAKRFGNLPLDIILMKDDGSFTSFAADNRIHKFGRRVFADYRRARVTADTSKAFDYLRPVALDDLKAKLATGAVVPVPGVAERGVERRTDTAARKRVDEMTPEELKRALLEHELTGIPNRRAYDEAEKQPIQASIDVDSLKFVNDNLSHESGDKLLKAVATALADEFGDQAYHISGDEFIVQGGSTQEVNARMRLVRARLGDATIEVELASGETVTVKGIGVSYGLGENLDEAESALQRSKERRQARGERAARGEVPAGVERARRRSDQGRDPAEEEALAGEAPSDRRSPATKLFGNLAVAQSIATEGFNSLPADRQRQVLAHMRRAVHDAEVFDAVVEGVAVEVVNDLVGQKKPTERLLDDQAMLGRRLTVSLNRAIPGNVTRFVDAVAEAVGAVEPAGTPAVAEEGSRPQAGRTAREIRAAERAGDEGHARSLSDDMQLSQEQEPGAQPGEAPIKKGYQAIAQKAIDFWNDKIGWRYGPLGKLPAQRQYLKDRYEALGKVGESQDIAKKVYAALSRADQNDQVAVYEFLTTQDAKPDTIRDEKVRSSAVAAKQTIDAVGQRLVEYGLLSSAAYEAHRGSYLPRVYLKHLLGEQAIRAIGSGKRLSDLGYLKKRQDLDEETRKVILGEITDPAFLASFGLSRTMRDLAIFDFLDTIAGNKDWVAPGATVEWRGRNVSPAWLNREAQELRRRSKLYKPEEREKALVLAEDMEATAESGLSELEDVDLSAYKQIPDTARYGVLRGTWVRQEIHNDLVGANSFIPPDAGWAESLLGQGGALTQVQQWWKMSKVALNPPTQARNFISNMILLHLSGVPAHRVFSGELVAKAVKSIYTQDRYFQVAKKYGLFSTTFANQELKRISDAWIAMQKEGGASIGKLKAMAAELTNFAGDIYQLLEAIGKIAKLRDAIDREGMSDSDAMIEAHETLFDYSLIPRSVQYLRNAPIGVPFLTFMYKMIPQMAKTVVRHPLRFAPYVALPWVLNELLKELYDVDDDDLDKLREAFPRWMKERGNMLLLPYKDDNGRWQVVDLGYLLPWGALSNAMAAASEGEYVAGARDLGLLSGPIPSVITAIATNTDPFTGDQIVHPEDSAFDQVSQLVNYVWNLALPGFFGDYGAVQRMLDAAGGKVDRQGNPTYTKGQALLRAFGINVYPVDPEATRAANLRGMGFEIEDIGARRNERLRDPNLTDEERDEIRAVYRELLDRATERLRQYREESEVHPNLATGGELEDVEPAAQ